MCLKHIEVETIVSIAKEAGCRIMEVYDSPDFGVERKEDTSPLTKADLASHHYICSELAERYTEIPIVSEEQKEIPYEVRKDWEWFWLIDPLDGTKEFIRRNGEFTINIALIHGDAPVLGVINVPARGDVFYAKKGDGAYHLDSNGIKTRLHIEREAPKNRITVVASRSHSSKELQDYIHKLHKKYPEVECISAGSALKFCMIAQGKAHIYPRFSPTMEWDTAAGQAIVEGAGGEVVDWKTKAPLRYRKEVQKNSNFIVI